MHYYFAPMEGLTDSIYRSLHHHFFSGIDRYYMPFISPTIHRCLTHREERELPVAGTVSFIAIPQLLTKNPDDFLWAAQQCADRGYTEVNLNLGCPSGTVVSKGKGSGMLADPDNLDGFLDAIFTNAPLPVSVKTRIGIEKPEEFIQLLEIYNRYPICELTIHPRVRKAFYNGDVNLDIFRYAVENSKNPICYNGNLENKSQISTFSEAFPQVKAVMIGRGLIGDPGMLTAGGTDISTLKNFHDSLLEAYTENFGGARNAMFRLKENWQYILMQYECSEKLSKKLRKTTDLSEYKSITQEIFCTLSLKIPK